MWWLIPAAGAAVALCVMLFGGVLRSNERRRREDTQYPFLSLPDDSPQQRAVDELIRAIKHTK